jgi:Uma2 family endonuclease
MLLETLKRRFTVEEYYRMAQAGILREDDRVELIQGEIVEMTPIGPRHADCVDRLTSYVARVLGDRVRIRVQGPIRLGPHSELQPDLALLRPRSYAQAHPGPGEVLLLVEVADTSLDYDRTVKLPLYARAGIPAVWLVDLSNELIELHRLPGPEGFREVEQHRRGQLLSLEGFPDFAPTVDDVLGPP